MPNGFEAFNRPAYADTILAKSVGTPREVYWRQRSQGTLKPVKQSVGERLEGTLGSITGARLAKRMMAPLNDLTPVGNLTGMDDGQRQFRQGLTRGNLGQAALGAGVFGLSMLPFAGGAKRKLADLVADQSGMFGGRLAKNADLKKLSLAEQLADGGADRQRVWDETGWFQGADGKWRFEIPDNHATMQAVNSEAVDTTTLGKAMRHNEAFRQYPELKDTDLVITKSQGGNGAYYGDGLGGTMAIGRKPGYSSWPNVSTALHETQHVVQGVEDFARGGSLDDFNLAIGLKTIKGTDANDALVLRKFIERAGSVEGGLDIFRQNIRRHPTRLIVQAATTPTFSDHNLMNAVDPEGAYKRLAGEVEARNVQHRMDWSQQERKVKPPWATEDVSREDQIVLFGNAGPRP